jgi:hypothetical protein
MITVLQLWLYYDYGTMLWLRYYSYDYGTTVMIILYYVMITVLQLWLRYYSYDYMIIWLYDYGTKTINGSLHPKKVFGIDRFSDLALGRGGGIKGARSAAEQAAAGVWGTVTSRDRVGVRGWSPQEILRFLVLFSSKS